MRVISFYSEDLKVDYLSLNLQFNNLNQIQKTADYLGDTFGCKSTLLDQSTKLKKTLVESLFQALSEMEREHLFSPEKSKNVCGGKSKKKRGLNILYSAVGPSESYFR